MTWCCSRRTRRPSWCGAPREDSLVFFEMVCLIEFYGRQRLLAMRALGLRRTRLRRACYAFAVGFPRRLCGVYLRRALGQGFKVVWVPQARPAMGERWARRPTRIDLPAACPPAPRME